MCTEPSMNKIVLEIHFHLIMLTFSVCIIVLKTVQVYKKFMEKEYSFKRLIQLLAIDTTHLFIELLYCLPFNFVLYLRWKHWMR